MQPAGVGAVQWSIRGHERGRVAMNVRTEEKPFAIRRVRRATQLRGVLKQGPLAEALNGAAVASRDPAARVFAAHTIRALPARYREGRRVPRKPGIRTLRTPNTW